MKKHSLVLLSLVAMVSSCAPKKSTPKPPTQTDLPSGGTTIKESDENYKPTIKRALEGAFAFDGFTTLRYDSEVSVKVTGLHEETDFGLMTTADVSGNVGLTVKSVEDQYKTFGLEFKNLNFKATLDGQKKNVLTNLTFTVFLSEGQEKCMAYFDLSNSSIKYNLQQVAQLVMDEDSYDPALFGDAALTLLFGSKRKGYVDVTSYIGQIGLNISQNAPISESIIPLVEAFIIPSVVSELDDIVERVAAMHPTVKNYSNKSYGFAVNSTVAQINQTAGKEEDEKTSGEVGMSLKSGISNGSTKAAFEQLEVKADITNHEDNSYYEMRAKITGTYNSAIKSNPAASFNANDYPKDFSGVPERIMEIMKIVSVLNQ